MENEKDFLKIETSSMNLSVDITDIKSIDFLNEVIKSMKLLGYHDVSIYKALKEATFDQKEYLDSVIYTENLEEN